MKESVVMFKLCFILCIAATIFLDICDVRAEGSAKEIIEIISNNTNKEEVNKAKILIGGILIGLSWANAHLLTAKEKNRIYCQPDSLSITKIQMIKILTRYSKDNIEVAKFPIGYVTLKALQETFPCE